MEPMARPSRYSPEVRERAVRMVREHGAEHPSQWAAIASIASKLGCTSETLGRWVRQAKRDTGHRGEGPRPARCRSGCHDRLDRTAGPRRARASAGTHHADLL